MGANSQFERFLQDRFMAGEVAKRMHAEKARESKGNNRGQYLVRLDQKIR